MLTHIKFFPTVCTWINLSRPFHIYGWKPPSCKRNTSIMRKFVIISWKTHPLSQYAITEIIDSTLHNPLGKDGRDVDGYQTKRYKNGYLTFKCLDIGQYHNFKNPILEMSVNTEGKLSLKPTNKSMKKLSSHQWEGVLKRLSPSPYHVYNFF